MPARAADLRSRHDNYATLRRKATHADNHRSFTRYVSVIHFTACRTACPGRFVPTMLEIIAVNAGILRMVAGERKFCTPYRSSQDLTTW